jgi:uncharacterized glyoxalase superfamily protein PhnB
VVEIHGQKKKTVQAVKGETMKFGYTIIYVTSVEDTLVFYENAFGLARRFLHESGEYGELETGGTILAFASHTMGTDNLGHGYTKVSLFDKPIGIEIGFVTEDVEADFHRAVEGGALMLKMPEQKPWGQTVAYVRAPEGTVIEICSPVP